MHFFSIMIFSAVVNADLDTNWTMFVLIEKKSWESNYWVLLKIITIKVNSKYFLLTEFEGHSVHYSLHFTPSIYGPSVKHMAINRRRITRAGLDTNTYPISTGK